MESFLKAVEAGQCEVVRAALERRGAAAIELDFQDPARDGNTALHLAVTAKRNKMRLIELLLAAGADCGLRNHHERTPAEQAFAAGCRHVAEAMVGRELDGLPADRAFRRLVARGSVELLRIFLEKRAFDIHTKMKLMTRALDELWVVRGVEVGDAMRAFLEHELIAHSYECDATGQRIPPAVEGETEADRRVELVRSYTKYLSERYDGDNLADLDEEFVVRLRAICECLHVLGDSGMPEDLIPLKEAAYLASLFLGILEKRAGFEIYKLVLNRPMIVRYLTAVGETLVRVRARSTEWMPQLLEDIGECIAEQKLAQYVARRRRACPELQRIAEGNVQDDERIRAELARPEFVALSQGEDVAQFVAHLRRSDHPLTVGQLWHRRHPKLRLSKRQLAYAAAKRELLCGGVRRRDRTTFRCLRRSYEQVRQLHTVKRAAHYIEGALVIDLDDRPTETLGLMAIKRVLQFLATDRSHRPRFTRLMDSLLGHLLEPLGAREATNVREAFSPRCSAAKYLPVGGRRQPPASLLTIEQARGIQTRLRAVYRYLLYVMHLQLIAAFKTFLGTAYRLRTVAQLRSYARYVGEHNLHTLSSLRFEHAFHDEPETGRVVGELKRAYRGMANELKLLSFVEKNIHFRFYHLQYHQTRLRVTLAQFAVVYRALRANGDYGRTRRLLHSYLTQTYHRYDISRAISISDANLALKELLRPYAGIVGECNEDTRQVVRHLEQLQRLMDPNCLFGIRVSTRPKPEVSTEPETDRYEHLTRGLLQERGAPPLSEPDFAELHCKLHSVYCEDVFRGLPQRHATVEGFFRTRGLQLPAAGAKTDDEELLQEVFDAKVNDLLELVEKTLECGSAEAPGFPDAIRALPAFVQFAFEFALHELLEILASVGVLRSAAASTTPILSGSRLRTFLGGSSDSLVLELLTLPSNATLFLNAIAFRRHSFRLYPASEPGDGPTTATSDFERKFTDRLQWLAEQRALFDAVHHPDCDLTALREGLRGASEVLAGRRFGSLAGGEPCHYALVDAALVGDFRAMIDLLTDRASGPRSPRHQLLQYLLRRTTRSHFVATRIDRLAPEERRLLALYLGALAGDVELFGALLVQYGAHGELHRFVHSDDHGFVERLLGGLPADFDWGRTDPRTGMTVLQQVTNAGNVGAVRVLVGRMSRQQLNSPCHARYTALNLAARLNLTEIVRTLVETGVDVTLAGDDERLPASWLIQYGNERAVVGLALEGVELTALSSELCLLHRAIEYDNGDVVRYLLEDAAVDPARVYSNCANVLHVAAGFGRCAILRYLLSQPSLRRLVDCGNLVKNTALAVACKERQLRAARILLEEGGASTEPTGEYGLNPLAFALLTNSVRLVRVLLRHGATFSNPPTSDTQPLNLAIRTGNVRLLELLLRHGVDVNGAPLAFINAVMVGSQDIVRLLVARTAAHVNHRDEFGQTALHVCAERDEHELAEELLRHARGAAINAKNRFGQTPLHVAVQRGHVRTVRVLLRDRGCSVDELDYHGETPLIRAVVSDNLALVRLLLASGASIERLRNSDPPVLLYLVQENHERILDFLLEHYAGQFDANAQDTHGNTLLYVATQHNHINIVKLLVDKYGARRNPQNHKRLTPLMIARARAYDEIFHFLEARLVEE
ncbi:uncharacterized protein LOC131210961 [Anopheles bellator]|uniref:uncharacterized protein LOC131210961 n=1 Tax=Anopheles bellator TaxID=139047 RepID=UPI002648445E|nr:uncharacterized protein LOC131210961 [Anopheles bellator]